MKAIIKTNFLILLIGITLYSLNAGMPEIKSEESKIRTEISGLHGNNLKPEVLKAIIEKIQKACAFVDKEIKNTKGHDRMNAEQALGRLETDLTFFEAILGYTTDSSAENKTILASFANSSSRYNMLLKNLSIFSLD